MRYSILCNNYYSTRAFWAISIALMIVFSIFPFDLYANATAGGCTTSSLYREANAQTFGIATGLLNVVVGVLSRISDAFYSTIINDGRYQAALWASVTLVIVMYGYMVLTGMARLVPGEIFMRLFKLGFVIMLVSPGGGWTLFNQYITPIFWGTTVELIDLFTNVSISSATSLQNVGLGSSNTGAMKTAFEGIARPIAIMDRPTGLLLSSNFVITIVGAAWTGPYGFFISVLLIWGAVCFLMALAEAFFSYLKAIVGIWFMFSLAPIFLVCLLFKRTQNIFKGWINVILGAALQIIFLFTFLGFFVLVVMTSLQNFLQIQWCYAEKEGVIAGMTLDISAWVPYMVQDSTGQLVPLGNGPWGFAGFMNNPNMQFPLDLIDILFFLLSSYVVWNYSRYVPKFASSFSSTSMRFSSIAASASDYFRGKGWAPDQIAVKQLRKFFSRMR